MVSKDARNLTVFAASVVLAGTVNAATADNNFALPEHSEQVKQDLVTFDNSLYTLSFKAFVANGDVDDAYDIALKAVNQRPDDMEWRMRLAQVARWVGKSAVALAQWKYVAAHQYNPSVVDQGLSLAEERGDFTSASEFYKLKVEHGATDQKTWLGYIQSLEKSGNPQQAIAVIEEYARARDTGKFPSFANTVETPQPIASEKNLTPVINEPQQAAPVAPNAQVEPLINPANQAANQIKSAAKIAQSNHDYVLGRSQQLAANSYNPVQTDYNQSLTPSRQAMKSALQNQYNAQNLPSDRKFSNNNQQPLSQQYANQNVKSYHLPSGQQYANQNANNYQQPSGQQYANQNVNNYQQPSGQQYANQNTNNYQQPSGQQYANQNTNNYQQPSHDRYTARTIPTTKNMWSTVEHNQAVDPSKVQPSPQQIAASGVGRYLPSSVKSNQGSVGHSHASHGSNYYGNNPFASRPSSSQGLYSKAQKQAYSQQRSADAGPITTPDDYHSKVQQYAQNLQQSARIASAETKSQLASGAPFNSLQNKFALAHNAQQPITDVAPTPTEQYAKAHQQAYNQQANSYGASSYAQALPPIEVSPSGGQYQPEQQSDSAFQSNTGQAVNEEDRHYQEPSYTSNNDSRGQTYDQASQGQFYSNHSMDREQAARDEADQAVLSETRQAEQERMLEEARQYAYDNNAHTSMDSQDGYQQDNVQASQRQAILNEARRQLGLSDQSPADESRQNAIIAKAQEQAEAERKAYLQREEYAKQHTAAAEQTNDQAYQDMRDQALQSVQSNAGQKKQELVDAQKEALIQIEKQTLLDSQNQALEQAKVRARERALKQADLERKAMQGVQNVAIVDRRKKLTADNQDQIMGKVKKGNDDGVASNPSKLLIASQVKKSQALDAQADAGQVKNYSKQDAIKQLQGLTLDTATAHALHQRQELAQADKQSEEKASQLALATNKEILNATENKLTESGVAPSMDQASRVAMDTQAQALDAAHKQALVEAKSQVATQAQHQFTNTGLDAQSEPVDTKHLIRLHQLTGNVNRVQELLQHEASQNGLTVENAMQQSEIFYANGNIEKAHNVLSKVKGLASPQDTDFWFTYGDLSWMLQDFSGAQEGYQNLQNTNKGNELTLARLMLLSEDVDPRESFNLALGGWDKYKSDIFISQVFSLGPQLNEWPRLLKIIKTMPADVQEHLKSEPYFWDIYVLALANENKHAQIPGAFTEALTKLPESDVIKSNYLWYLVNDNNSAQLSKTLADWYPAGQHSDILLPAMIAGFAMLGQYRKALKLYQKQMPEHKNNYVWLVDYADMLDQVNQTDQARRVREQALYVLNNDLMNRKELSDDQLKVAARLVSSDKVSPAVSKQIIDQLEKGEPAADKNELGMLWGLSSQQYAYTEHKYRNSIESGYDVAPWLDMTMALRQNDKAAMQDIIENPPADLSHQDQVNAARSVGQDAKAQTLAFEGMQKNPDNHSMYDLMTQTNLPAADHFDTGVAYRRLGDAHGFQGNTSYTYHINNQTSVTPYNTWWNTASKSDSRLVNTPNVYKTGARVNHRFQEGDLNIDVGYRNALKNYMAYNASWVQPLTSKLSYRLGLGYHNDADETTLLLLGGMKNNLDMGLSYQWTARDFFDLGFKHANFYDQDGSKLGSGGGYTINYRHLFAFKYPNWNLNLFGGTYKFTDRDDGTSHIQLLIPDDNPQGIMPGNYSEYGASVGFGQEYETQYTHSWKPFGEVGILDNSGTGAGQYINAGIAGSVIGRDHLAFFGNYSVNQTAIAGTSYLFGMQYSIYF